MGKKIIPLLFIISCLFSCKYDLLPVPSSNGNSSAPQLNDKKILPPENLQASQGDYRSVTLTWDAAPNATQYLIYSASTEFDTFEKKGETKGTETSFTITEETGSTKAYYVKAVDYYGNISRASYIVKGTSLSVPIITEIEKSPNGEYYSINWWMANCSEDTYEDLINYTLNIYEEGQPNPQKVEIPGNQTSYQVTTLKQSTVYKFTVEAYKPNTKQKHEISDSEPIETGHRIVPNAPENFKASKGESTKDISISFNLPSPIESYNESTGTYTDGQPIYFVLKKRLASAGANASWTTVYDYIGYNSSSMYAKNKTKILGTDYTAEYNAQKTIQITDTVSDSDHKNMRGQIYEYQIQSFTDAANSAISSEITSIAADKGWTIAPSSFSTNDEITISDDGLKIEQIGVSFFAQVENMGIKYKYILTSTRTELDSGTTQAEVYVTGSENLDSINGYRKYFTDIQNESGYYQYKLYIAPETSPDNQIPEVYYECISAPGRITVISDATKIPAIKHGTEQNFTVIDGFKDHFELQWDSIGNDCSYVVTWTNQIGNGFSDPESTITFTENPDSVKDDATLSISKSGGVITLRHSAESGEIRKYTLTATQGLTTSKTQAEVSKTLGTAEPQMQTPDYKTITVKWNPVQKALNDEDLSKVYTISATYKGQTKQLKESYPLSLDAEGKITCVISEPEGYDKAAVSGTDIEFKVTTLSENKTDKTTGSESVYTLGPAKLNLHADIEIYKDYNKIFWNRIEGAKGYLVFRTAKITTYDTLNKTEISKPTETTLYIEENKIFDDEGNALSCGLVTTAAETICFTDKYEYSDSQAASESNRKNQQRAISWGIPYEYTVVPVLSSNDLYIEGNKEITLSKAQKQIFKDIKSVKTATCGYGLGVKASKAESSTKVTLTWNQPYNTDTFAPTIYRRKDAQSPWEGIQNGPSVSSGSQHSFDLEFDANDTNTYEYAVSYGKETLDQSYLEELSKAPDPLSPTEQRNMGYTLSLPRGRISALNNSTSSNNCQVMFRWNNSTYDFNSRAIGPDYYQIQILNKNKVSGWTTIGKINIDKPNNDFGKKAAVNTNYESATGVKIISSTDYNAVFEPVFESDISYGQMEVLRDYKLYFRLVAVKETLDDKGNKNYIYAISDSTTNTNGKTEPTYAARNITNRELIRCLALVLSDAIYQVGLPGAGINDYDRTCVGETGKINFHHDGATDDFSWSTYNEEYQHIFRSGTPYTLIEDKTHKTEETTALISPIKIKFNTIKQEKTISGSSLYKIPETVITVSNTINNSTYGDGSFTIKMNHDTNFWGTPTNWQIYMKYGNATVDITDTDTKNKSTFKSVFPFNPGVDTNKSITSYTKDHPLFSGKWWDLQEGQSN